MDGRCFDMCLRILSTLDKIQNQLDELRMDLFPEEEDIKEGDFDY